MTKKRGLKGKYNVKKKNIVTKIANFRHDNTGLWDGDTGSWDGATGSWDGNTGSWDDTMTHLLFYSFIVFYVKFISHFFYYMVILDQP